MDYYNFILVFTLKIKHLFCNIFSRFVVQFFFVCVYDIKDSLGLFNYFICVKLSLSLLMSSTVNLYSSFGFLYLVMYNWQSGIRRPASATSDSPRVWVRNATSLSNVRLTRDWARRSLPAIFVSLKFFFIVVYILDLLSLSRLVYNMRNPLSLVHFSENVL